MTGSQLQGQAAEVAHEIGNDSLAEILKHRAMTDGDVWDEIFWRYGFAEES